MNFILYPMLHKDFEKYKFFLKYSFLSDVQIWNEKGKQEMKKRTKYVVENNRGGEASVFF